MTLKKQFSDFSQRLADFTARFENGASPRPEQASTRKGARTLDSVFSSLQDLFTRGVTREELTNLVKHDPRETFRFFTREIDFAALKPLPWHKRYPSIAWKVFIALAYRLSPARRIAFAVAIFAFLLGMDPAPDFRDPVGRRILQLRSLLAVLRFCHFLSTLAYGTP